MHEKEAVMITIKGKHNVAECFTDTLDPLAREQIQAMANSRDFAGSKIRIMPDVHAGKGCTIGTTMTVTDKVAPSMVGVDIGCGMYVAELGKVEVDFETFDKAAHALPSGLAHWPSPQEAFDLTRLACYSGIKKEGHIACTLGTLGGGNHFIELDRDDDDNIYLVIHSGSRYLGAQVAEHYTDVAVDLAAGRQEYLVAREETIRTLKREGKDKQIQSTLKRLTNEFETRRGQVRRETALLYGEPLEAYLEDVAVCIDFARRNRELIAEHLLKAVGLTPTGSFHTIHNYIDVETRILRKGAISAEKGERVLIPINMADGSLICIGKGNEDWNRSAPHGAGRLLSRSKARGTLTMEAYRKAMEGIYSTTINPSTLDESPMAYKDIHEIMRNIRPTCSVERRLYPIYNFKAGN